MAARVLPFGNDERISRFPKNLSRERRRDDR